MMFRALITRRMCVNALRHASSPRLSRGIPHLLASFPSMIPSNQGGSVSTKRFYSDFSDNNNDEGADTGDANEETALIEKEDSHSLSTTTVPDSWPILPIIAINRYPLFPGFIKKVDIVGNDALKEIIRRKVKLRQPYVGVFVKKDDENRDEAVTSLSQLYNVGSFAQIMEMRDLGTVIEVILSAHRRIRLLESVDEDDSQATRIARINGRRTGQQQSRRDARRRHKVEKDGAATSTETPTEELTETQMPIIIAKTENLLIEKFERTPTIKAKMQAIIQAIRDLVSYSPFFAQQINLLLQSAQNVVDNPVYLCDLVATIVHSAETDELQKMMEEVDIDLRLDLALVLLEKEKTIAKLKHEISKSVENKVQSQHRKYLLHEQLKAIKKELGLEKDDKQAVIEKMEERLKDLRIPEHVMKVINEEIAKLGFLDPHSSEFSVARNYLDWLTSIPWGKISEENADLEYAAKILEKDHYGMKDIKERILEFIAVGILKKTVGGKILCFHGPPGVGKTSIAKSIARALNREYYRFSVGGMTDVAEIKGHRRTYIGAMPGKMIQCLKKVQTENPLVLIDEVDKIGRNSYHGDPASALLELLDPEQNANFLDHFIDVPVDLSKVLFICTANVTDTIPEALLDRMELIEVSGYVAEEKVKIADQYLIPQCRKACALEENQLIMKDEAIETIIKHYCRESGVRNLQKNLEKIFRKVAFKIASKPKDMILPIVVDHSNLVKFIGREKFTSDRMYDVTPPGVVMGLAWTSMGGSALYVESSLQRRLISLNKSETGTHGEKQPDSAAGGNLEATGHLGDVMKESMKTAYTVSKNTLLRRVPENDFLDKAHIHVHVPEGATPKDGPSAGCTITSALISLALNKPLVQNMAMTGEISLTGKILPVGGIREKVIAAKRAGVNRVILPSENKKDFDDLPDFIKKDVEIHFVSHYDEIFDLIFPDFNASQPVATVMC